MSYTHDPRPESSNDLFGEVIDSYADAEVLEDGVLVELYMPARFQEFPINRMTRHLFDDLEPFVEAEASLLNGDFSRALASILRTKCAFAQGDPENTGEIGDMQVHACSLFARPSLGRFFMVRSSPILFGLVTPSQKS
jgi:hypothetical protein